MIANSIRRFIAHRDGAVGITFAVSLIALVPAVGTAIDYGRAVQFKTALQNAADNAALPVPAPISAHPRPLMLRRLQPIT